ncbi:MAG: hypothetical protein AAGI22_24910 [Planctomycetota bacterium]
MRRLSLASTALLAFALAPATCADVHFVGLDGNKGFTTIQDAVDAAQPNDTIVVAVPVDEFWWGPDPGFVVDGKPLTILGVGRSGDAPTPRVQTVRVRNLGFGEAVVLSNLDIGFNLDGADGVGLVVEQSFGPVRIDRCRVRGQRIDSPSPSPTVELDLALDVRLVDTEVIGGPGGGLVASRTRLVAYRSTITGGEGLPASSYTMAQGAPGSTGLVVQDRSFAWLGLSTVEGGAGGGVECIHGSSCTAIGGDGGIGTLVETGSLCVASESELLPGPGGPFVGLGGGPGTMPGNPGSDVVGAVTVVPGTHRDLVAPRSVESGETLELTLLGEPGEQVSVLVGNAGGHRYLGSAYGVLLAHGGVPVDVGVVPASGVLNASVSLPPVASDEASTWTVQALFRASPSTFRLSTTASVSVMGDATPFVERPARIHVNAASASGGYGRSWQSAASNLRDALVYVAAAEPGGNDPLEVWVAAGTYTASPAADPLRKNRMRLPKHLRVLGGFDGTETDASQRDPRAHVVSVTADLAGDDRDPMGSPNDNAQGLFHAYSYPADNTLHLSGLTLRSSVQWPALQCVGTSLELDRCHFIENGRGSTHSALRVTAEVPGTTVSIQSCRFRANRAGFPAIQFGRQGYDGGPLDVTIHGSAFIGNRTSHQTTTPTVGYAMLGAAVTAFGTDVDLDVRCCTFLDNDAPSATSRPSPVGGIFAAPEVRVSLFDCVLSSARHANGIDTPYSLIDPTDDDEVAFNCVEWLPATWDAATHVVAAPGFVDRIGPDGVRATGDEDIALAAGSPCVDAGSSPHVPAGMAVDLDGAPRFVNDPAAPDVGQGGTRIVDLGALERQGP